MGIIKPKKHPLNSFGISETSKCRSRLAPYCVGDGLDLGFGGDPINDSSIRIDLRTPYTNVGSYTVQLHGNANSLFWFNDNCMDYIYSSHLLEDFQDIGSVLAEWIRVLKPGGRLIIFCPDEKVFRAHCAKTGQPLNPAHKHHDFSLDLVLGLLEGIGKTRLIYKNFPVDIYSWDLVVEKI